VSFFADRSYVVTGSTRGIGRAVAGALDQAGARVVVNGRDAAAVRATVSELDNAVGVTGSVGDDEVLAELTSTAVAEFGRLDGLVNNVGINLFLGPLLEIPERRWQRTLQINSWVPLRLTQLAVRDGLGEHGGGGVVNVSTVGARRIEPGIGAYCASKAALEVVTKVLAAELGERRVRCNAVAPGMIPTETSSALLAAPGRAAELAAARPAGRLGTGQDVADLTLFLLSDKASWITGEVVTVDGGAQVARG